MDFLSTPLPDSTGTEEHFVKQRPNASLWLKGVPKSPEWRRSMSGRNIKFLYWGGKEAREWTKILNGDYNMIKDHIKNGTMEQYATYREWKDGVRKQIRPKSIKRFMTPVGIMNYIEAKEAFGFKDAEAIRNRIRSDKPKYADWHWLEDSA